MRLNASSVNGKWSPQDSETRLQDLTDFGKQGNSHAVNGNAVNGHVWLQGKRLSDESDAEEHVADYTEQDRLCAQLDRAQCDEKSGPNASELKAAAACRAIEDDGKEPLLLSFADAPHYLQFNPFIHSGYRSGMMTTKMCLESVFWWTNETINIWSHIFGWMLFFGLTLYDLLLLNIHASYTDKFIVGSLLVCFQVCMLLSSLYHTFSCRSEKDYDCFLTLDLLGIALSLLAIYMSGIYYAFWCHQTLRSFYLITVAFIFGLAMVIQIPRLKLSSNVKMATFVGWAAYGVVPTLHWTIVMGGLANPMVQKLLPRVLGMYGITGLAFLIYITKFPERYISGRVDYIGASHQWWHVFVVIALYYWHNTGIQYVEYRMNHGCMIQS